MVNWHTQLKRTKFWCAFYLLRPGRKLIIIFIDCPSHVRQQLEEDCHHDPDPVRPDRSYVCVCSPTCLYRNTEIANLRILSWESRTQPNSLHISHRPRSRRAHDRNTPISKTISGLRANLYLERRPFDGPQASFHRGLRQRWSSVTSKSLESAIAALSPNIFQSS